MKFFNRIQRLNFNRFRGLWLFSATVFYFHEINDQRLLYTAHDQKNVLSYCNDQKFSYCSKLTALHFQQMQMNENSKYISPEKRNGDTTIGV